METVKKAVIAILPLAIGVTIGMIGYDFYKKKFSK